MATWYVAGFAMALLLYIGSYVQCLAVALFRFLCSHVVGISSGS